MAKATLGETKPPVTLELSNDEADLLLCVLGGFVAGDPNSSPRRHADTVAFALETVLGHDFEGTNAYQYINYNGGIAFGKYEER